VKGAIGLLLTISLLLLDVAGLRPGSGLVSPEVYWILSIFAGAAITTSVSKGVGIGLLGVLFAFASWVLTLQGASVTVAPNPEGYSLLEYPLLMFTLSGLSGGLFGGAASQLLRVSHLKRREGGESPR
jgi:hypothetical protein